MSRIIRGIVSLYAPGYAKTIVYMLQSTEYQVGPYLAWYWRTNNFFTVARRRSLDRTRAAKMLYVALAGGMLLQTLAGLWLAYLANARGLTGGAEFGAALILSAPVVWAHLIAVPLLFGRWFIVGPRERRLVLESERIFARHPGAKIAVAGSYGKTSMKELLLTVLAEGKKVAATPGNKNVAISHAYFARKLSGDEDVIVIEYGEGRPGDVARFTRTTHPDMAVITGIAPAHLDQYKTLAAAARDIFSVAKGIADKSKVFVNAESEPAAEYIEPEYQTYSSKGALGWKVSDIKLAVTGTMFTMRKGKLTLQLQTGLLGRHQVGPVAFAAALAHELGLTPKQIQSGVARTVPFEHRMQPYPLAGGWVIDDTYNGNLEGIKAGLALLRELPAKRKLYVTPGLVDQGQETERVHRELGRAIAQANPDAVVLMQNSVTKHIQAGMAEGGYSGKVQVQPDPLAYYTGLEHIMAAGDLVLMQNDWTDNYN